MMSSDTGGIRRLIGPDYGWIGVQVVLLAVAGLGGLLEVISLGRGYTLFTSVVSVLAGAGLLLAAGIVLLRSVRDLANKSDLTMSPTPVESAELVDDGIYGVVRHPMYLGVLLALAGYALILGSWISLVVTIALVPFFFAKSRHEERLLEERFPNYADYARRVRWRFIPWVL
jgi:protein-S-isoprenylcysteine O-methyltransferase Ste14